MSRSDVLVDVGNNNGSAYAQRCFRLYGHPSVQLLEGGRKKWELDQRDLVTVPWSKAAAEDGTFKTGEALRARYADSAGLR